MKYTAIITQEDEWWLGRIAEVRGVNAQEKTREEVLVSLEAALHDVLEVNRELAREAAGAFEEVALEVA